jgi:ABC-2 type transport system permease protein
MQVFVTLARRELAGYFLSFIGYIIIASAMFLIGISFIDLLRALQREPTPVPVTELFYITWYFWLILLLTTPAITMRLFALEKFSGTFETLMTTPVTDLQVILAKFSAALIFYLVLWLPLLGGVFIVRYYAGQGAAFDAGALASTWLGILLIGCLYISMGCCASALTRNQTIAAMIALALGAGLFLLGNLANQLAHENLAGWQSKALACFGLFRQMHDFARGVVDSRFVVLTLSLTFFFLFLTLRIIESRRWK